MNPPDDEHLDSLLSRAVEALEPCPPGLVERIEGRIRRRRVRRAAAGAALAAAMLLLAVSYLFWPDAKVAQQHDPRPAQAVQRNDSFPSGKSRAVSGTITARPRQNGHPQFAMAEPSNPEPDKVRIRLADGFIGEPLESDNPRITILWIYPASRSDDAEGSPESRSPSHGTTLEVRVAKSAVGPGQRGLN